MDPIFIIWIDVSAHWACCSAARGHQTFDADVLEGREEVGRNWDATRQGYDQWRRNGCHINVGLGRDHVGILRSLIFEGRYLLTGL